MTEPVTITCVVELDGNRDVYAVEYEGEENRAVCEAALRRMTARAIYPDDARMLETVMIAAGYK